jgi:A/G-specific adenine glycosylase
MKRFPTVYHLADASDEDVNAHWAGLGFYRRARLLHKGAKRVVEHHDGQLPQTMDELTEIEGIGPYTASAIASIAFNVCVPVVDGNVCRVLSRLRGIANHIKAPILKDDLGWKLAKQIVSAGDGTHAGEVNQALMELGATYCAPSGTGTDDRDPLKSFYLSSQIGLAFVEERIKLMQAGFDSFPVEEYMDDAIASREHVCKLCDDEGVRLIFDQLSDAAELLNGATMNSGQLGHGVFPTAPPKKAKREEVLAVAALSHVTSKKSAERRWLLVKRPANGLLAGQWEFPSACVWTSASTKPKSGEKRKNVATEVPTIVAPERVEALNRLLQKLSSEGHDWLEECNRHEVGAEPIEHVFSHVRHTMWIEHGDGSKHVDLSAPDEWTSPKGKEVRWMSEDDMHQVGITAGVKKILNAVKRAQREQTKKKAKN